MYRHLSSWCVTIVFALFLTSCGGPDRFGVIAKDLKSSDVKIRSAALGRLGSMKSSSTAAVPYILKALKDDSEEVRISALNALVSLDMKSQLGAIGDVVQNDKSVDVRKKAMDSAVSMAPESSETLGILKDAMNGQDLAISVAAATKIFDLGKGASHVNELVAVMKKELDEGDASSPPTMAMRLGGDLGPKAAAAAPVIQAHLNKPGLSQVNKMMLEAALRQVKGEQIGELPGTQNTKPQ